MKILEFADYSILSGDVEQDLMVDTTTKFKLDIGILHILCYLHADYNMDTFDLKHVNDKVDANCRCLCIVIASTVDYTLNEETFNKISFESLHKAWKSIDSWKSKYINAREYPYPESEEALLKAIGQRGASGFLESSKWRKANKGTNTLVLVDSNGVKFDLRCSIEDSDKIKFNSNYYVHRKFIASEIETRRERNADANSDSESYVEDVFTKQ